MTRKEQIEYQASKYANDSNNTIEWGDGWEDYNDFDQVFDAFKNGAKWADANPQFSKEEFIEKACEWLKNTIDDDVFINCGGVVKIIPANEFVEYFRKTMEE